MTPKQIVKQIKKLGLTQKDIGKILKRRPQQISAAIHNGDQPTLLGKILRIIEDKENEAKSN